MSEPDYRTMGGAEFARQVGADPEKWAEAFRQRELPGTDIDTAEIAAWFRDAMEAAVKAAGRQEWPASE